MGSDRSARLAHAAADALGSWLAEAGALRVPVYFIYQDAPSDTPLKIGRSKDVEKRRKGLQTGNPETLKLVGYITSDDDSALESALHRRFAALRGLGEWFALRPDDILPILMRFGPHAFVGTTDDSFRIVGYDKDAVPEYLGVWEWGDLELSECCPFCGCLGGMHFQDASQMHYCIACDTLTNFDEFSPDYGREEPEA